VRKMLEMARTADPCGARCPHGAARSVADVRFQESLARYRERVETEIGQGSEWGARWWSRRLVKVCEEAGLVRPGE
jgi:hypothetical protein